MKTCFCFLLLIFPFGCYSQNLQKGKPLRVDTVYCQSRECMDCPSKTDTIVYKSLKCGLYKSLKGDIAFRAEYYFGENLDTIGARYINWIYNADPNDTINGGLKEMKYVIDIATFKFLNLLYWADKNYVYGFTPMSDGGTVYFNDKADRKTFVVFGESGYAKDKNNIYYRSDIIDGADVKTFKVINDKDIPELARDRSYFYITGKRLDKKEMEDYKLNIQK